MMPNLKSATTEAIELLSTLISTPSISRDETRAADILESYIIERGISVKRIGNNVRAYSKHFDKSKPATLLNAHIDTVAPVSGWTRDPFTPVIENGKLYGLGSNDCGGGLVSLLTAFIQLHDQRDNLIFLASCEEEVSGNGGFSLVLPYLPEIDYAIVGEPTGMQPAIAEKGLMVVDAVAHGKAGHAARHEGINAIYEAMKDIEWVQNYQFPKKSDLLGEVKATVTIINSGTQHNVVPDRCSFTIDIRSNELYRNEEIFDILSKNMHSELKARSFRLSSSSIDKNHPIVKKCIEKGRKPFGSPTLSDMALMPFPSIKLGPGQSSRSHNADEYILLSEIEEAINFYLDII